MPFPLELKEIIGNTTKYNEIVTTELQRKELLSHSSEVLQVNKLLCVQ